MASMPFALPSNLRQWVDSVPLQAVAIPLGFLLLLGMLILPVPTLLLDLFFTFNIALSLVIIFLSISAARPLSFSVFPTVLLFAPCAQRGLNSGRAEFRARRPGRGRCRDRSLRLRVGRR
jgi:flagellar biosynthesis protein FlhA